MVFIIAGYDMEYSGERKGGGGEEHNSSYSFVSFLTWNTIFLLLLS